MRSEHQCEARGRAHGLIAVGEVKAQASRGESVDVRRFSGWIAVAAQSGLQIIHEDQQHVWPRREGRGQTGAEQRQEQKSRHSPTNGRKSISSRADAYWKNTRQKGSVIKLLTERLV
jgi:hypothetical protein